MTINNNAWTALETFMQRNEYIIDREYVNACRHYASRYDETGAFEVWCNTTNRYAACMMEISRLTGNPDERPGPHGVMDESGLRAGLIHLAQRIPLYAMLRTGNRQGVEALLTLDEEQRENHPLQMLSC